MRGVIPSVDKVNLSSLRWLSLHSIPGCRTPQRVVTFKKVTPPQTNARNLQTCSFNVKILVDGCTKSVEIDAPGGRVVDAVITNQTSTLTSDNGCLSSTDLSANITFPVTREDYSDDLLSLVAVGQ